MERYSDPIAHPTRRHTVILGAAALLASCDDWRSGGNVGRRVSDPAARRFYRRLDWRPAWTDAKAKALVQITNGAAAHGLDPKAFAPKVAQGLSSDESLTLSALAYAKALASGFVDPKRIEPVFTLDRNEVELEAGLVRALEAGDLKGWFDQLPPQDDEYKALSAAYLAALGQTRLSSPPTEGAPVGQSMAPADQARQLAANLERRRWLSRTPPVHRIDVNTAGAFFGYFIDGSQVHSARTVVGRDDHPTPSIQAAFRRVIANPVWRVPTRIAEKEILPKGRGYLASQHMRFVNGRLVQAPGPKNALGQVKFDVEDPYDIYLHDTPAKALFAETDRHRSHGCVRVEGAVDFARGVADETGKAQAFDEALASQATTPVELGQSIAVRMLYHTAYLDETGQVLLDDDVYGTDDQLAKALGMRQAAARARATEPAADVGP
jgi:murein L,D-transpeptidase YcbB/YkuD